MHMRLIAGLTASIIFAVSMPLPADSEEAKIQSLERQIEMLESRIAALEARETFTSFMPNFAERFHVMHLAGEAGDWAVASHELQEMERLARVSQSIDAEKGALMLGMMEPNFEALEHAIEHGNHEKFEKALADTTNTCNSCHAATGSAFIRVSLDASDTLSLRHPHKFMKQKMPGGHTH